MTISGVTNPSFRGVYAVTMPKVDQIKDENERKAYEEAVINTVVMGFNASVDAPKVSADQTKVYYKIDDKNDKNFENGFNNILEACNKQFNVDVAKKVYLEKVDESEYDNAQALE